MSPWKCILCYLIGVERSKAVFNLLTVFLFLTMIYWSNPHSSAFYEISAHTQDYGFWCDTAPRQRLHWLILMTPVSNLTRAPWCKLSSEGWVLRQPTASVRIRPEGRVVQVTSPARRWVGFVPKLRLSRLHSCVPRSSPDCLSGHLSNVTRNNIKWE